jgi:hypothetical protein
MKVHWWLVVIAACQPDKSTEKQIDSGDVDDVAIGGDTLPDGHVVQGETGASKATCATTPCLRGPIPAYNQYTLAAVPNGDGTTSNRFYALYRPANLVGSAATVIVMGGSGGCSGTVATTALTRPRWQDIADANRLQIAVGVCTGTSWQHNNSAIPAPAPNAVTDEPYITALVDALVTKHAADPDRIYATGASSGGGMAKDIACDPVNAGKIRGVAVISHDGFETDITVQGTPILGSERCPKAGPALAIVIGDVDFQSFKGQPGCLTDHCFDGLTRGAAYYASALGCAAPVPSPVTFGSPTAANQRYTWPAGCGAFTSAAVEAVNVHMGGHAACKLDSDAAFDATACGTPPSPTNGFFTAHESWQFFANLAW